jgi:hypothetical protein
MSWPVDGVQINFSGTGNSLISAGGSSIQAFNFTGAKGKFTLPGGARGGTTVWGYTRANSNTTAQIDIEAGIFDLRGTNAITSTYGGYDVWVAPAATLEFDYANLVMVTDLFDNNNDNSGYIVTAYNGTTGVGGVITTSPNTFKVLNAMPVRNNGQVTIDTATLSFYHHVLGPAYTNGDSYYQPANNNLASTTVLHNGTLYCDEGFRQDGGTFQVGTGGATLGTSQDSAWVDFEGGYIKFPGNQDYETLNLSKGHVVIHSTTVNMELDGQSNAAGHFDQMKSDDTININTASTLNVTVNNVITSGMPWDLIVSTAGNNDITGGFGTVTPANTFNPQLGQILNVGATTVYRFTAK